MRQRHRRHWLVLGGSVLALLVLLAVQLWSQRQALLSDAGSRLRVQVRVVETNLARQLWSTQQMLTGLVEQMPAWQMPRDQALAGSWLRRLERNSPGVRTILLLDADGVVLAASRDELVGMNFAEREYFRAARQGNDARRLHLSPPFRTVLGVLSVNATQVLQDVAGALCGRRGRDAGPRVLQPVDRLGQLRSGRLERHRP
jgi:C4-dicarboxylate-specific signal transduction histidine kinase